MSIRAGPPQRGGFGPGSGNNFGPPPMYGRGGFARGGRGGRGRGGSPHFLEVGPFERGSPPTMGPRGRFFEQGASEPESQRMKVVDYAHGGLTNKEPDLPPKQNFDYDRQSSSSPYAKDHYYNASSLPPTAMNVYSPAYDPANPSERYCIFPLKLFY